MTGAEIKASGLGKGGGWTRGGGGGSGPADRARYRDRPHRHRSSPSNARALQPCACPPRGFRVIAARVSQAQRATLVATAAQVRARACAPAPAASARRRHDRARPLGGPPRQLVREVGRKDEARWASDEAQALGASQETIHTH
jgi:hypothetical protein